MTLAFRHGAAVLSALLVVALSALAHAAETAPIISHQLDLRIDPQTGEIEARDAIKLPSDWRERPLKLRLNAAMGHVSVFGRPVLDQPMPAPDAAWREITVGPAASGDTLQLNYSGVINQAPSHRHGAYRGGHAQTRGMIGADGVFLPPEAGWTADFGAGRHIYTLTVRLPRGWRALTTGKRLARRESKEGARSFWSQEQPLAGIHLAAARWHEYSRDAQTGAGHITLRALLRTPDEALANRYLEAASRYLELYQNLLGPYPYPAFSAAENFWETGYGMPGFTLLGPRVIRLPFLLTSSYPHEILHNWWGNGVDVDVRQGNWSEGLTAYLADHLMQALDGKDSAYRRALLQRYAQTVTPQNDIPIAQFISRHDRATQAVGYGKTLMMFHMLRGELGDEGFLRGLRTLYRDKLFQAADMDAVRAAFESASGRDSLEPFFTQWSARIGAPTLHLDAASTHPTEAGHLLSITLSQTQPEAPYNLTIPIAITTADGAVQWDQLHLTRRTQVFERTLTAAPTRVDIDPAFDLFRRLDAAEIPPAFNELFGAADGALILPAAPAATRDACAQLGKSWGVTIRDDAQPLEKASANAVWICGRDNRHKEVIQKRLDSVGAQWREDGMHSAGASWQWKEHAIAVALRTDAGAPLGFVHPAPGSVEKLARKLPHYGKYGVTAFDAASGENRLKREWNIGASPLSAAFDANGALRAPATGAPPIRTRAPLALSIAAAKQPPPQPPRDAQAEPQPQETKSP
ncbi:M1 family metallopeptidase [Magnetofaba australis]|uniref:Putative peptidase M28 n=1 Tax=Magnetofaba australis IT-1 TaxID=1434232 RepID=A0A1Y2K2C0_9PROT|nr:M1 family aminopeptidase [Magnetofaba australis]OSM02153.1 putative peptidase M28 [Magnetofaba australis IT-1]